MLSVNPEFKKPLYYALGVHGAVLLFLLISALTFPGKVFQQKSVSVVNASMVMAPALRPVEKPKPKAQPKHHVKATPKPRKKVAIRKEEAVKKIPVKKKVVVAKKAEKKRIDRKKEQKRLAEKKRERARHAERLAEQKRLAAAKAAQIKSITDRYNTLILQSISENWLIPANANKHLQSKLFVQLAPDGAVLNVRLLKSSGNVQLDRSAIAAVYKASPLPVPKSRGLFNRSFKQLTLIVRPENVLG